MAGMSGGPKTSTIRRPAAARTANTEPVIRRDDSLIGELTRPIPAEKQLVPGRGRRTLVWALGIVVTLALVAALFVLPFSTWLHQREQISGKEKELSALEQANADLVDEVDRLNTPAGVEAAAREEIGFVKRGEIRLTVLPAPEAPITLPSGWPYDALNQVITARQQPAATTAP
jgi:cell division protein FtsB